MSFRKITPAPKRRRPAAPKPPKHHAKKRPARKLPRR